MASRQLESTNGGSLNTSTNGSPGGGRVLLAPKPGEDVKDKMEQQLKLQRAAHQQRKILNAGEVTRSATPGMNKSTQNFNLNININSKLFCI